jgi:hypothetical protein
MTTSRQNHLKGQTSPYLLQHLHNPVDWYPWGEEALDKAQREGKPLLVSIGYSACHWCHVMERESFTDPGVADLMNALFVCVKVDREERPDIDHLYMDAVQLVSGRGGWPLNCFALPDGRPFWGGTYFPKDQWKGILDRVASLFREQHDEVVAQAGNLTRGVASNALIPEGDGEARFSRDDLQQVIDQVVSAMDATEGGTRGAPKFPLPVVHEFLLQCHGKTGNSQALDLLALSLDKMAGGGIYDQIGGGFSRYATDGRWRVPHFEKMLYDNAQLVSLYARAWQVTGTERYRQVVYETIAFANRELGEPGGLYHAALDADSQGEEGRYYVWTEEEVDRALGEAGPLIREFFRVGEEGLWEQGRNILLRREEPEVFASRKGLDPERFRRDLKQAVKRLLQVREQRVRPALDNKVIVSWNALMIGALCDAYAAFQEQEFLDRALRAAIRILEQGRDRQGVLYRKLEGGRAVIEGFLDDHALLIQALIRLYEVSMETRFILAARDLAFRVMERFTLPGSSLFAFAPSGGKSLPAPACEVMDNVIPASNSVMAHNLFRLAQLFGVPEWGQRSSDMLRDVSGHLNRFGSSFSNWGSLLMNHVLPFHTVVVAGPRAGERIMDLNRHYLPGVLVAGTTGPENPLPVFQGRYDPDRTRFFVCSFGQCREPAATVDEVLQQLSPVAPF